MSYTREFQGDARVPDPLESAAAMQVGLALFASSRLDLAVQLYLDGLGPAAPRAAPGPGADARLERLLAFADSLADKELRDDFLRWIVRAHQLAPLRQALRHGRWLPDPRRGVVLVMAPPGEATTGPRSYGLEQLEELLALMRALFIDLQRLCAAERGISMANAASFLTTQPIGVVEEAGP